ncbi:hypothetical protein EYC84_010312 [Monilinia fructicola]|uniref:Uncharacterized protein n=1 Tax=Monilinia fructicola TaxID=38448 RepID=A0A5M9JEU8_MONFR|nr:hypothetical protein EYC84_010312 [Monilinia fructicola]
MPSYPSFAYLIFTIYHPSLHIFIYSSCPISNLKIKEGLEMDFAPYQVSPEETRALSPPPRTSTSSPRQSISPIRRSFSPGVRSPAFLQSTSNAAAKNGNFAPISTSNPWIQRDGYFPVVNNRGGYQDVESGRVEGGGYNSGGSAGAGWRCATLLVLERKSDYVRFHAWQSALLFTAMFVVHLMFSWSLFMSWSLLLGDISLIIWLTRRAYLDANTLDRCEVPIFGRIASSILDDE